MWNDSLPDAGPSQRDLSGCIVCGRGKRARTILAVMLPSGRCAKMCDECDGDSFKIAEAERRMDAAEAHPGDGAAK